MSDTRNGFFRSVERSIGVEEIGLISEAYQLAKALHRPQSRKSGERYFEHPRAVARILMDFGPTLPEEVMIALLHDAVEDCYVLPRTIKKVFGEKVGVGVEVLSKYAVRLEASGKIVKERIADETYWFRICDAPSWTRRVKLADRLHNLGTMRELSESHKRKQVASTKRYILPMAHETDVRLFDAIRNEVLILENS